MTQLLRGACAMLIIGFVSQVGSISTVAGDFDYVPSYGYLPEEPPADPRVPRELPRKNNPDKEWTFELTSGAGFGNVRDSEGGYDTTSIPFALTMAYKLDNVSLDKWAGGIFRGYTDFVFRPRGGIFLHGQESYYGGLEMGPRYNFVQPGWPVVPFCEGTVGFAFTDSDPKDLGNEDPERQAGLGQDFSFTFSATLGIRIDIDDEQFIRLQARYWHASNAGLSEPEALNKPIDEISPELVYGFFF